MGGMVSVAHPNAHVEPYYTAETHRPHPCLSVHICESCNSPLKYNVYKLFSLNVYPNSITKVNFLNQILRIIRLKLHSPSCGPDCPGL